MQNSAASDAPLAAYASATDGASHPQAQQAVPPVGNVAAAYDFGYRRVPRQYEVPPEDRLLRFVDSYLPDLVAFRYWGSPYSTTTTTLWAMVPMNLRQSQIPCF